MHHCTTRWAGLSAQHRAVVPLGRFVHLLAVKCGTLFVLTERCACQRAVNWHVLVALHAVPVDQRPSPSTPVAPMPCPPALPPPQAPHPPPCPSPPSLPSAPLISQTNQIIATFHACGAHAMVLHTRSPTAPHPHPTSPPPPPPTPQHIYICICTSRSSPFSTPAAPTPWSSSNWPSPSQRPTPPPNTHAPPCDAKPMVPH